MTVDDVGQLRLLRAAEYAALEPWALLRAVRGPDARIVDFTYRDINPAGASHHNRRPADLIGCSLAETLPEVARIGLIARYAHCVETGEPLILDDFSYTGHTVDGDGIELRRYDIRGARVDADHLSLTWRDVSQRYLTQQQVAESEERYRLLAENSWDVVAHIRDGVLIWVSQSAEGPSGAPGHHWIGRRVRDVIPTDDWPVLAEVIDRIDCGAAVRRRLRLLDAHGSTHWVELRAKAFHDDRGNRDGETISLRVIDAEVATERELEEARRRQAASDALYRQSMDSAAVGMALTRPDGSFIDANRALCEFLGYDAESLRARTLLDVTAPDSRDATSAMSDDLAAGRIESYRLVQRYVHASGRLVWGDLSVGCIRDPEGTVKAFVSQIMDITAEVRTREQLDEARSELSEALRQSEHSRALMRAASDALLDPQVLLEPQRDSCGRIVDFVYREMNRATSDYLGLAPEELLGRGVIETMPGLKNDLLPGYIRCLETGEPLVLNDFSYDNELLRATRRYDIRVTRATAHAVVLTWRDVTDRFHAAQDLAQARDLLRASTDAMLDPQTLVEAITDPAGSVVDLVLRDVNEAFCDYISVPRMELLDRSMLSVFPNVISSGLAALYARCATTGEPIALDDFEYFVELLAKPRRFDIRAAQVRPGLITAIIRDSTARFEAAQRVAESEEQYRLLAENSSDAVIRVKDGVCIWVSPAIDQVLGAPPEHWVGRPLLDLIIPGQETAHFARLATLAAGDTVQARVQVRSADGAAHWVHLRANAFHDARGNPDGIVGALRLIDSEVAAEQRAEDARRRHEESEAHYKRVIEADRALLRASADSMLDPQALFEAVRDAEGRVTDFRYLAINRATALYLQVPEDDLVGRNVLDTFPNMVDSGLMERYAGCLDDGEPVILTDFAYFNERLDDARRYDIRATKAGPDLLSLSWSDVTERYQAGQRLAASEEQYRLLAMNSTDAVVHIRDGVVVWVSPSVEGVLGAPPEHWVGRDVHAVVPPEDLAEFDRQWSLVAAGESLQERIRVIAVDGVPHWVHLRATPFYDADGRRDGGTAALRLIDAEVAAERQLEQARREQARANELYRRSVDNAAIGMCLIDPEGHFVDVNPALCDFFGYDAETLKTRTWQQLTAPAYLEADLGKVEDALNGRRDSYRMLKQYIHADGRFIWGDLSVSCIRDREGRVEQFVSQIIDVTATVEADELNVALNRRLTDELRSAASYIASIMPSGLSGEVTVASRYLPSRELGGDCFDYTWIDDDHLIVYLIDVSGHGIEPALLAVSVQNMLRAGTFPARTLLDPSAVLTELNRLFQMEQQSEHFFTIWYGVYQRPTRTLRYASAGSPPAYAFTSDDPSAATELHTRSAPVGAFEDTRFTTARYSVRPGCRILIYSDGASEAFLADGRQMSQEGFRTLVTRLAASPDWTLDGLIDQLHALTANAPFQDDLSLIQLAFD